MGFSANMAFTVGYVNWLYQEPRLRIVMITTETLQELLYLKGLDFVNKVIHVGAVNCTKNVSKRHTQIAELLKS